MNKLKMRYLANEFHFFIIPPLLIGLSIKYIIFIPILLIYLIYIIKKKIHVKIIIFITLIFSILFLSSYYYKPKYNNAFKGIITDASQNKYVAYDGFKGLIFYSNEDVDVGDYVYIKGEYKNPRESSYEGEFDYRLYLKTKRIYKISYNPEIIKKKHYNTILSLRYRLQNHLNASVDKTSFDYINTLLLGKNTLDDASKDNISELGISHLFSISGFHIMFIYMFLSFILSRIFKSERLYNNIIILFFIFYMIFTNFMISILRSSIMIILSILTKRYNRKYTSLDILSMSALIILFINPLYLYQTGFILTYIITFFLIISNRIINKDNKIKSIYELSIIAFISSMPIIINLNGNINVLSILLIPILSIIVGYVLLPYSFITLLFNKVYKLNIFRLFNNIIKILNKIDYFKIRIKYLNIYLIIIYYIIFIFILIMIEDKKFKKKYLIIPISYLFLITSIRYASIYPILTFIDVGQGDSALIELPHNKGNILIDTYGYNASYLKSRGISKIDYLIISHTDNDHCGNIDEIIKEFKVCEVVTSIYEDYKYSTIRVKSGDKLYLSSLVINILAPISDLNSKNNNSIVMSFVLGGYKILFTGDAEVEEEKGMLEKYNHELDSDILKVGHHGSSTSSSQEFINKVSPNISIISCGEDNKYGFPNKNVLNTLSKSSIYRTDTNGNIKIVFKNKLKVYYNN